MANEQQIDNLVSLIDGYVEKDGHHLNVIQKEQRCACLEITSR